MNTHVFDRKVVEVGHNVFTEGEEGDRAFIVQDGEVEVYKEIDGEEVILGTLGRGAIFGEMALLDDKPRMASARAKSMLTVLVVNHEIFTERLKKTDPFIRGLLNILADSVRSMSGK